MDEKNFPTQDPGLATTPDEPPVIETASATTSRDNANSGAKPIIIAAIGLALLLFIGTSMSSCMVSLGRMALDDYAYDDNDFDFDSFDDDDWDDLLDEDDWEDVFGSLSADPEYRS